MEIHITEDETVPHRKVTSETNISLRKNWVLNITLSTFPSDNFDLEQTREKPN